MMRDMVSGLVELTQLEILEINDAPRGLVAVVPELTTHGKLKAIITLSLENPACDYEPWVDVMHTNLTEDVLVVHESHVHDTLEKMQLWNDAWLREWGLLLVARGLLRSMTRFGALQDLQRDWKDMAAVDARADVYSTAPFYCDAVKGLQTLLRPGNPTAVRKDAALALAHFYVTDVPIEPEVQDILDVVKTTDVGHLVELASLASEACVTPAAKALSAFSVSPALIDSLLDHPDVVRTLNRLVLSRTSHIADEAAGALWNIAIDDSDVGRKMLSNDGSVDALLRALDMDHPEPAKERFAGALAQIILEDNDALEVVSLDGIKRLISQARTVSMAQEQLMRCLANLAVHIEVSPVKQAIAAELTQIVDLVVDVTNTPEGPRDAVKMEAAGIIWNLCHEDTFRERLSSSGAIEALVGLAQRHAEYAVADPLGPTDTQDTMSERLAGALWVLSVSDANADKIVELGGVEALIAFVNTPGSSSFVHETSAGALWTIVFSPGNGKVLVEKGAVDTLAYVVRSSPSALASYMAALALAFSESACPSRGSAALKSVRAYLDTLKRMSKSLILVPDAGDLRCSQVEFNRIVDKLLLSGVPALTEIAAFALFQFVEPSSGVFWKEHKSLIESVSGGMEALETIQSSRKASLRWAKPYARRVLEVVRSLPESVKPLPQEYFRLS